MSMWHGLFGKASNSTLSATVEPFCPVLTLPPDTVASTSPLKATLIVCAGTNATSRSETAGRLKSDPRITVVEAADAAALKTALSFYTPLTQICTQLFYFFPPGTTKWMRPEAWWREVRANFAQWLPEIAESVQTQATINSSGGGFLRLQWEQVTPHELEAVCHYFDEALLG